MGLKGTPGLRFATVEHKGGSDGGRQGQNAPRAEQAGRDRGGQSRGHQGVQGGHFTNQAGFSTDRDELQWDESGQSGGDRQDGPAQSRVNRGGRGQGARGQGGRGQGGRGQGGRGRRSAF